MLVPIIVYCGSLSFPVKAQSKFLSFCGPCILQDLQQHRNFCVSQDLCCHYIWGMTMNSHLVNTYTYIYMYVSLYLSIYIYNYTGACCARASFLFCLWAVMGSDGPAGGGAKGGGGVSRPGQRFLFFFDSVFSRSCIMTESVAWCHGLFAKLTSPHRHFPCYRGVFVDN